MNNDGTNPKKRTERETLLFSVFFSIIGSAVAATSSFSHFTIGRLSGKNVSMAGFLIMLSGGYGIWSYFSANRIAVRRNKALIMVYCILLLLAIAVPFLAVYYHWTLRALHIIVIVLPISYGLDTLLIRSQGKQSNERDGAKGSRNF